MAKRAVGGREIGDVSHRWNFESYSRKFDVMIPDDDLSRTSRYNYTDVSSEITKSGPLLLSSKNAWGAHSCLPLGFGWPWHSWRRRWFVLTQQSLMFFKSDPSIQGAGGEVDLHLILGGILLKRSARIAVKSDKKLLSISFPGERRPLMLKAETFEDYLEWKTVLEHAIRQAL